MGENKRLINASAVSMGKTTTTAALVQVRDERKYCGGSNLSTCIVVKLCRAVHYGCSFHAAAFHTASAESTSRKLRLLKAAKDC